jgi:hypothetical protein
MERTRRMETRRTRRIESTERFRVNSLRDAREGSQNRVDPENREG